MITKYSRWLLCNYQRVKEQVDLLAKTLKWQRLFAWGAKRSLWERIMTRRQSKSVGKLCESTSEQMANKRESSYNKMQKECDKLEIKSHRRWKNKGKNGQRNVQKMLIIICSKYISSETLLELEIQKRNCGYLVNPLPLLKALATDPLNSSVYQVVVHSRKTNSLVKTIFMNS